MAALFAENPCYFSKQFVYSRWLLECSPFLDTVWVQGFTVVKHMLKLYNAGRVSSIVGTWHSRANYSHKHPNTFLKAIQRYESASMVNQWMEYDI